MPILTALLAIIAMIVSLACLATWAYARHVETKFPPVGAFIKVGSAQIHHVHRPAAPGADLPPVVFIHGASANLCDQRLAFDVSLRGRAELLFFDRPGHGWSERGEDENALPDGQASVLAGLMDALDMPPSIIVGHSFGGSVAASFALAYPQKTEGLVFLAAATHPWPGGIAWYYHLLARPFLGRLFAHTFATPFALMRIKAAIACVFHPNPVPEGYRKDAAADLLLRPRIFRSNAADVCRLKAYVEKVSRRYSEIAAPTIVVTGDKDAIVYEHIHSAGLARDISGAVLLRVKNLGHKPDYIARGLVVAAIEYLAGKEKDLQAIARDLEEKLAVDGTGVRAETVYTGRSVDQTPERPSAPI